MEAHHHFPVLVQAILNHLPPQALNQKAWVLDGTFGRGGHIKALLQKNPRLSIIALDQDKKAIQWGLKNLKPVFPESVYFFHANFHNVSELKTRYFKSHMKQKGFDVILLDLGVSSPQMDEAGRGFSLYKNGPLDMRMDQSQRLTAAHIVNQWGEQPLKDLFYLYGEIRKPGPVVKAIIKQRQKQPFEHSLQLAHLIQKHQKWHRKGFHPATPYFLALRLKVNKELEGLKEALPELVKSLNLKGRLFILSFHSLEDRIVKRYFKMEHKKQGLIINKKVIRPDREEIQNNPRSRSGRLRIFEKTHFPPRGRQA